MRMQAVGMEGSFNMNSPTVSKRKTKADLERSVSTESTFATSDKKNTSSLPDEVVGKIQEMAREGAKNGVYMGDKFISDVNSYKTQHVSPDRSRLISLMTPMVMSAKYTNGLPSFFRIFGLPFTGMLQVGARNGASMSIYDSSKTEILSYDCRNGWLPHQSQAEGNFYDETTAIYHEAYTAARAEMKANPAQSSDMATNSGFDMRA